MKSKPAAGLFVLLFVGIVTWGLTTPTGAMVAGGREQFLDWRADNTTLYYGIWLAEVIVIGLPALWFTGKRMGAFSAQQDQAAVAARGVGRLVTQALRGNEKAVAQLVKLLDDGSPAVRYQSARALALLDDKATDEELFRKVRYWDVDHKLGLIDVLKRTMDMRTIKLLRVLGEDRNPMVVRKARTALTIVSSRSGNIDDFVAKRHKQAQAKQQKAERKKAEAGGTAPSAEAGNEALAGPAAKPAKPAEPAKPAGPATPTEPAAPADPPAPADPSD